MAKADVRGVLVRDRFGSWNDTTPVPDENPRRTADRPPPWRQEAPGLVGSSKRMCWPVPCYGEVGGCGERSTSRVISLGAKTRNGGPQKPVPRLV